MAPKQRWARLWAAAKTEADDHIRKGVWYRVVNDVPLAVILDVEGSYVVVSRKLVEIRDHRPDKFTVVARPKQAPNPARGTVKDLGHVYGVCPACGNRMSLFGEPRAAMCPSCGHRGEVAWWETG